MRGFTARRIALGSTPTETVPSGELIAAMPRCGECLMFVTAVGCLCILYAPLAVHGPRIAISGDNTIGDFVGHYAGLPAFSINSDGRLESFPLVVMVSVFLAVKNKR